MDNNSTSRVNLHSSQLATESGSHSGGDAKDHGETAAQLAVEESGGVTVMRTVDVREGAVICVEQEVVGLAEKAIALKIEGVGTLSTSTLSVMKKWHAAMSAIQDIKKAFMLIEDTDFSIVVSSHVMIPRAIGVEERLKNLPLSSLKMEYIVFFWRRALTSGRHCGFQDGKHWSCF
ncbi:uncharacterized protein PITG_11245 [Phytophthora infestans T30-4]|uniref:Uncharacterized protein n=1 Tax=Phytophthora infestans (strain T30-4) TaxID=403677 RepID=D0NGJ3_PHYIT|nr:uncharacterized protein PITG_11245 [Phytophthora infestans T30-4]EEY57394.1 hypothetical protein PITG_11245 [Phytophthora infestans T30-4]|eukprot:XP_002902004.1 hypothetical protein PITG_11245 [Phytophthora infestans T30-4]